MKLKSKIDEIFERLEKEGKIAQLTDDELLSIDKYIKADMDEFRKELIGKQIQSEADTVKIILNA